MSLSVVRVVLAFYERFRLLIHEFAKFGVIGVIGLIITNGGYDLLYNHLGMGPVKASTIATIAATIVAYIGNRYWSFRCRERTGLLRETIVFFVLNGIGLLIQDAAVGFNYYVLGLQDDKLAEFVALNVGIAAATLFRFWSYRKWVWLAPAEGSEKAVSRQGSPGRRLSARPVGTGRHTADGNSVVLHANGHGAEVSYEES